MSTHDFHDLATVVDETHALFDAWSESGALSPPLSGDGEIVLRLAVHEWIANLVQHAVFRDGRPEVRLHVEPRADAVRVFIEDNSMGFDLLGQVEQQKALLDAPAPSERGRGLLMLITCTENLDYLPASRGRQRLSFDVVDPDPAVFQDLFVPADAELVAGDGSAEQPLPPVSGRDDR